MTYIRTFVFEDWTEMKRAFEILPPIEMAGFSVVEETSNISSGDKTWILSIAGMSIIGSAN